MLKSTGVPSATELGQIYPDNDRLCKGPVAIIECFQNIPCNPCSTACPRGAILPLDDINERPAMDAELCNGCALCVANCPGLAIFVVDQTYNETQALLKIPYEFSPLPDAGAVVVALNRQGKQVGQATVLRVQNPKAFDKTAVLHLLVSKDLAHDVRSICVGGWRDEA